MAAWTRLESDRENIGTTFFMRPLGQTESMFYWDAVFSGISDTLQQVKVEIDSSQASWMFSSENVKRAWLAVKQLHPLLAASIHEGKEGVHFMVNEARFVVLAPGEIEFLSLRSDYEATAFADKILNGPRTLSSDTLAKIWVVSFPQHNHNGRTHFQVFFHSAHCICDGMAQNAMIQAFFDILVHVDTPETYVPKGDLESRLAPLVAMEELYPPRKYSLARQRWRIAIARVISGNREAALKGGHTLPRTITPQTFETPVASRTLRVFLTKDVSNRVIASCRRRKITLGQALAVLAQLAHARMLHRLRSQGKISKEDWDYRIRQPMHMGGPANLRPYLDPEWVKNGGAGRVCVAMSFFGPTLPFVPVSRSWSHVSTAEPGFEDLLSRGQFFHRCRGPHKMMVSYLKHPLLTEFSSLISQDRLPKRIALALKWRARQKTAGTFDEPIAQASDANLSIPPQNGYVLSNACSSFGNMDNMIPPDYPLERTRATEQAPLLHITSILHYLRCRPTEFYLTSMSYAQQIQFVLFFDVGVYEENLAMQWLEEVARAAEWYLGTDDAVMARL